MQFSIEEGGGQPQGTRATKPNLLKMSGGEKLKEAFRVSTGNVGQKAQKNERKKKKSIVGRKDCMGEKAQTRKCGGGQGEGGRGRGVLGS